jgi:hypothetical protein
MVVSHSTATWYSIFLLFLIVCNYYKHGNNNLSTNISFKLIDNASHMTIMKERKFWNLRINQIKSLHMQEVHTMGQSLWEWTTILLNASLSDALSPTNDKEVFSYMQGFPSSTIAIVVDPDKFSHTFFSVISGSPWEAEWDACHLYDITRDWDSLCPTMWHDSWCQLVEFLKRDVISSFSMFILFPNYFICRLISHNFHNWTFCNTVQ